MLTALETVFTNPIVAFILLVGVVVFVHELGHYVAGRLVGIDVEEFSLGFGPKAIGFRRGITEFKICWLPLGGYVRFYGSEIGNEPPPERRHRALLTSPVYKRATISIAGPLANFILSFAVMVALSAWGMPQAAPVISVLPASPAAKGGLRDGDTITAISTATEKAPVRTWQDLSRVISKNAGKPLTFEVARAGEPVSLSVVPADEETQSNFGDTVRSGRIGVMQFLLTPRLAVSRASALYEVGFRSGDEVVSIDAAPVRFGWEVRDAFASGQASSVVVRRAKAKTAADASGDAASPPTVADVSALIASSSTAQKSSDKSSDKSAEDAGADRSSAGFTEVTLALGTSKPVYVPSELTVASFETLPKGDARALALEAWRSCGLQEGDTFVSFGENAGMASTAALESPVQISSWIDRTMRAAKGAGRVSTSVSVFGWNGALRFLDCEIDLRESKDAFGRVQWAFDFPVRFLTRGVAVAPVIVRSEGIAGALADGGEAVLEQAGTIFAGLSKLITGSLPLSNLGGPIAIARVAGDAAQGGALLFILTISWMSVNIGMFNLLPLPALDGGSLLLHGFEAAYGKPLPLNVQAGVQKAGVVLILLLFVVVFYNDLLRLFSPS